MNPTTIRLMLAGDTNVQERSDPASAFVDVAEPMRSMDVVFVHWECPFSTVPYDPNCPPVPFKPKWKHTHPDTVRALQAAGVSAVSLASNVLHGPQAVECTIRTLDRAGIAHAGTGMNLQEARTPAIVERSGVRIGLLSYTSVFWPSNHAATPYVPGVATIKATTAYEPTRRVLEMPGAAPTILTRCDPEALEAMVQDVTKLRAQVDVVVLSCHWGVSGSPVIHDYQRQIAHAAIDAGADILFGHHPHVVGGIEVYRKRPIFYSLGNFAFDWYDMRGRCLQGIVVVAEIAGGKLARVAFRPVLRNAVTNNVAFIPCNTPDGKSILDKVVAASVPKPLTRAGDLEVTLDLGD